MTESIAPRRVLYVVSLFPCFSETFIVREIQALVDAGVQVRILSLKRADDGPVQPEGSELLDRARQPRALPAGLWHAALAMAAHPLRTGSAIATVVAQTWRTPLVTVKSLVALARALEHLTWVRAFDPEYIHAHWSTAPSTAAWVLSRVLDRPFGFTCHAHDVFVNHHLLSRKIDDAALAVTISQHNVDWLDQHVSPAARRKMQVVHCGVDLERIAYQPHGRDGGHLLAVGRLCQVKGFATLVDALALLRDQGLHFDCTVIGEGPARAELEARIANQGLGDRMRLAGAQPQSVVRAELARATAFVLPCEISPRGNRDGIPVALMEAMAAGCPVVSCPISGIPELISDGINGLLAPQRDAPALAAALSRLLSEPSLRQRLAVAARDRIEVEFDARKEAGKLRVLMTRAVADAA